MYDVRRDDIRCTKDLFKVPYINYQGAKVRKKIDIHKKNNDLPKENGKSLFSTCNSNYS